MPISRADYEPAAAHTAEPAGVKAGAQALADATTAAAAAMAELVKQTNELQQWATKQISAAREMADTPSAPRARPKRDAAGDAMQAEASPLPPDRAPHVEKTAAPAGVEPDEPPAKGGATEELPAGPGPVIPPGQAPPEEQAENAVRSEWPGAGRDFKNRFDAAQGRINNHAQDAEELPALLDQAITLLESVSQHPALRDYGANKRKLEEIEQRLNSSGNVQ
jgi:hypothetical protein